MNSDIFKRKRTEPEPQTEPPAEPQQAELQQPEPQQAEPPRPDAGVNQAAQLELLRRVYRSGVEQGLQQAALAHNQARPPENGGAPAGIVTGFDPAHLSRQQRRDIRERVRRGESVRF